MNVIRLCLFIVIQFLYFEGICQNQTVLRSYFDDADYDISQEDYSNALGKLLRIYNQDSANANVNYLIGTCYLNSIDNKKRALKYLQKATSKISPDYKSETYDEKNAPVDTYNLLGDALALDNNFDLAIEFYNKFLITIKQNEQELIKLTERKIRSCEFAKILIKNPVSLEKKNLTTINSIMSDCNPVLTSDQKQLFFSVEQGNGKTGDEQLIYKSKYVNEKWESPVNFTYKLSQNSDMITSFVSNDGKSLLLIENNENENSIYETKILQNKWQTPKKLRKKINSGNIQLGAYITKDGKTIFFSSNRKGGFGGLDIYKSFKKNDEWQEPINLGPVINTPFDDINPKMLEDNTTLFFSSKGHSSIGGFDVFYSKLNTDGSWQEPANMGYPFNTSDNETDYWPIKNGFSGYMSRFEESGVGEKDIYFLNISLPKENLTSTNLSQNIVSKDTNNTTNNNGIPVDLSDTSSLMTILIKVTKNPLESAYLKEIEGVRAFRDQDSVIRYYFGQYRSFDEASKDFDNILKIGFYSAQLKKIKEDTLYYYATSDLSFGQDTTDIIPDYSGNEINNDNSDTLNKINITENNIKNIKNEEDKNKIADNKETNEQKKQREKNELIEKKKQEETLRLNSVQEKETREKEEKQKEIEKKQKYEAENKEKQKEKNTNETIINKSTLLLNEITDNLIKTTDDIFTIQISTLPKAANINYFKNIPYVTEHDCKDGKYRYSSGVFENIGDAGKYLEELKSKGYADAYIINFNKARTKFYNEDITDHIRTYNLNHEGTQTNTSEINEEVKLYSIQIASSIKPADAGYFKGITDLKEKLTQNGFYKYYYGKYNGYKNAKIELEKARELGYKDAFIIKYSDGESISSAVKDEKEKTEEVEKDFQNSYTIQVASTKKQSDLKYFRGLKVNEIKGKNDFYIYIYGDFKSLASARKKLTKVKELGFKDAYINKSEKYK